MNSPVLTAVCVLATTSVASASILNGGFESSPALDGWLRSGTVAAVFGPSPAPLAGSASALLTCGNTPAADAAAFAGTTTAALSAALAAALPHSEAVRDGAVIKQSFDTVAGSTLSLAFRFNNAETANNQEWPDAAFVVINGQPELLATSGNLPTGWTPSLSFSKADLPGGPVTVALCVFNFADFAVDSQLLIDSVQVSAPPSPCGPADVGRQGGLAGADRRLDNNDFVVFIDLYFQSSPAADMGAQGGTPGADGQWDNNDFVVFVDSFFAGQAANTCGL